MMNASGLSGLNFSLTYGSGDDPLHAFYIPALGASVRYDRMTGYFSSHALGVAAAGVAHLITNGGRMRLLVGAQLDPEDVAAIEAGYDPQTVIAARLGQQLPDPEALADRILRKRLEALAWMVARGTLELRVVVPKGPGGRPLPAPESRDYFHPKIGIFTDAGGEQVAFNGSINESVAGWQHNYECFTVFRSWSSEEGRAYVAEQVGRFERLWDHREPDWISLPIPDAVRSNLLRYAPATAPTRDPLEKVIPEAKEGEAQWTLTPTRDAVMRERIIGRFLRDAPHLIGAAGIGTATAAVTPWPHQETVAHRVVGAYPARYLFCDEVGLGKTIQAGLVLRELWLRGHVQRALILAPKSVLRQWQEEVFEKFALDVPVYDGKLFRSYDGTLLPPTTTNPWNSLPLALASSQLVKRRDRQDELLSADPWDLVLVDEAHHARRRDFLDQTSYRPNRLLELLKALQARTQGLVLMTATPMQVDPIEVWDLLDLLGLSGEWGADGRNFLRFYDELRRDEPDWEFVFRMFHAELEAAGGALHPAWAADAQARLGPVGWLQLNQVLDDPRPASGYRRLPEPVREVLLEGVKRTTPLRRLVFRNTRPLLRDYVKQGLLHDNVPHRDPRAVWIRLRPEEHELYLRIEEYISNFYRKYEEQRKGLGFVMTVYRRRLTSSFYAVRCSLERRLSFLRGQAKLAFDEDDLEQDILALDKDEELADTYLADYRDEIAYVEDFLRQLRTLSGQDSKVEQLLGDLEQIFRQRDTVLVFTQYTDTMDALREQLRSKYGGQVACYSGRGGEWWDGTTWVNVTKEELKNAFRDGERVKILLATEAASEGLNLQTCGVLINYDMPWNPMRVEQRIGRIDRIGQRYPQVWIRNYFYRDTVEAQVYQALDRRINWFQDVVGPLQPILARVGRTIQEVAMRTDAERPALLKRELHDLDTALGELDAQLDLDAWSAQARPEEFPGEADCVPVTMPELAAAVLDSPTLAAFLSPHPTLDSAFWLDADGTRTAVTFDRDAYDRHPDTLRFLTYGSPLLGELLQRLPEPDPGADPGVLLRVAVDAPLPRVSYTLLDAAGQRYPVRTLAQLRQALDSPADPGQGAAQSWTTVQVAEQQAEVRSAAEAEAAAVEQGRQRLHHVRQQAVLARAGRLLLDAALVELALGQQPDLLAQADYPIAFDTAAIRGLGRHGHPWAPLLRLVLSRIPVRAPQVTDPFFAEIQGASPDSLRRRHDQLARRARQLVSDLVDAGIRG